MNSDPMNANDPSCCGGQDFGTVDQLRNVTLLGIAVIGAAFTLLFDWLTIG